ncbi:MAG: VanZ family protein [Lachnospiraceae bacterium]|nr:VanZ family protein [Lachnospiraceae bacterium]
MLLGFVTMGLFPISIISLIIYAIIYLIRRPKDKYKSFSCHLMRYMLIGCVLCLMYLTIFLGGFEYNDTIRLINLHPFVWIKATYQMGYGMMMKQLLTNIAMFVPYGVLIPAVFSRMRKWWKTGITVFATSFVIEAVQYFIGRSSDVDDLIMNTIGGCLGYGIFFLLDICLNKKK